MLNVCKKKLTNIRHKLGCLPSLPNQHVACKILNSLFHAMLSNLSQEITIEICLYFHATTR